MDIRSYARTEDFLTENIDFLEREEAANSLLLGLAMGAREKDNPQLLAAWENGRPVFCSLRTPPRNLIIYGLPDRIEKVVPLLMENLGVETWAVPGVIGPAGHAEAFADAWRDHHPCWPTLVREMWVYRLDTLLPTVAPAGQLRLATPNDAELAAEWMTAFNVEALGEFDPAMSRKAAGEMIEQGRLYLWEHQEVVSMAAVGRPTRHGTTVHYVYTPPEQRRRGYAGANVAEMSRRMLEKGYRFCSLFADFANPTSNKIYRQMGYEPVKAFKEIAFK